jgi:ribose 5-phosphate isomerase RpiB
METVRKLIMNREGIGFFKAILESYEDVGLLTVRDGRAGEVEIIYPSEAQEVVASIIADMQRFGIVFREAGNV